MGRKGETTGYVPPSFEEFYTRKLEALQVMLKGIIRSGTPYVVYDERYACKVCHGRIKLYTDGLIFCLVCGQMPSNWSQDCKDHVAQIMQRYPYVDECAQEWRRSLPQPQPRDRSPEAVAFGGQIEEARLARGLEPGGASEHDRKANRRPSSKCYDQDD